MAAISHRMFHFLVEQPQKVFRDQSGGESIRGKAARAQAAQCTGMRRDRMLDRLEGNELGFSTVPTTSTSFHYTDVLSTFDK